MADQPVLSVTRKDSHCLATILSRSLDDEKTDELIASLLTAAGTSGGLPIVLDMSKVDFAPSVTLGALVKLSKSFKLDGRRLILAAVQSRIRNTIAVTRLDKLLEICPTVTDAEAQISRKK